MQYAISLHNALPLFFAPHIFGMEREQNLPLELRSRIAAFAAPKSSDRYPIDFLVNATIIPEEWGTVFHMRREGMTGRIKVLACRKYVSLHRKLADKFSVAAWAGLAIMIGDSLSHVPMVPSMTTASTFVVCAFTSMFFQSKQQEDEGLHEILVADVHTRTIESSFVMRDVSLEDMNVIRDECELLHKNGKKVVVDLRYHKLSPQLELLIKCMIDTGTTKVDPGKGWSLKLLDEHKRKKILENLHEFCGVK